MLIFGATPYRMWRTAQWLTNVEDILVRLTELSDSGIEILSRTLDQVTIQSKPLYVADWVENWIKDERKWRSETEATVS